MPADQPKKDGFPVWAIVLIVLGVLLCAIPFCVIIILTLLGPSIGNVFSDIILDI
ncbi:MAG: pilus assembly protein [Anaerolineae bacterium]|nr:pilus assembly protein [Anaerolineae bacterium]